MLAHSLMSAGGGENDNRSKLVKTFAVSSAGYRVLAPIKTKLAFHFDDALSIAVTFPYIQYHIL